MSRLDEMIREMCPDGVPTYQLREIFDMKNGYTPSKANPLFWENGTIPWFRMEDIRENGGILSDSLQHITVEAVKGTLFPANSIIVATSATIGVHALITVESLANQRFTYLTRKKDFVNRIEPRFAYYYCFKLDDWCLDNTNISSFASVDMDKFSRFKFPVPPLEVQREIVRILDNFTELTAELTEKLTAELTARKKQYEFYRDKLLTFDGHGGATSDVVWRTLGEVCKIKGRIGFRGYTRNDMVVKGHGAISFSPGNISNHTIHYGDDTYISWDKYNESPEIMVDVGDVLLCKTGSTLGKTAVVEYLPEKATINPQLVVLKEIQCNNRFLKYILTTSYFQNELQKRKGLGSVPNISQKELGDIKVPVPPLDKQQYIVSILDRFDALCNDITEGIPAEIEARTKQYEYYRDKLLTFKAQQPSEGGPA